MSRCLVQVPFTEKPDRVFAGGGTANCKISQRIAILGMGQAHGGRLRWASQVGVVIFANMEGWDVSLQLLSWVDECLDADRRLNI